LLGRLISCLFKYKYSNIYREFACEVLFEQDIDGKSVATLILDALVQV
jgi:hypothetical protein